MIVIPVSYTHLFFVDSNGNIVGDTYSGAKSAKEWKQVIEKELEKIKNK